MTGYTMTATPSINPDLKRTARKIKKCQVEKKRRMRMERALDAMKTLALQTLGKNPSEYDTMEKADILDVTVKVLLMSRQQGLMTYRPHATVTSSQYAHMPTRLPQKPQPRFPEQLTTSSASYAAHHASSTPVTSAQYAKPSTSPVWLPW